MRAVGLAIALALGATSASAQTLRPFTTYRQLHGETRLSATLEYAAGILRLAPGRSAELYRMDASYDGQRFLPISDYDAGTGEVTLGLRADGEGGIRVVSGRQLRQAANVSLSPQVDLALDMTLGATDADLELGGLRVEDWDLRAGASQAVVRFSQPNGVRCRKGSVTAGAAELTMIGLGNSRCDRIDVEGGMGKVVLDFRGAWTSSSAVAVKMAVGELTLRLPRRVGIRLTLDKFLASFDPAGLVQRDGAYESPGYADAERRLDIAVTTAVGGVKIAWVD
ncbi:MAG TPA: LiaF domain-containing protein [Gemmatimonadales bacterium]|nr:LiaF domain-containing protein [Gemmatimonadales bacterium]